DHVKLHASANRKEGTAVYLLMDVSGSMSESVPNAEGAQEQKLAIAKRAAIGVAESVAKYAGEDKSRDIRLGIARFSDSFNEIIPLEKVDAKRAGEAINKLHAAGGTAIGNAVKRAQEALDASGLKHQHILIMTDGENTSGVSPSSVAAAINALPEELRPSVYVVAFDVNAAVFSSVKDQGWQIFSAANGKELGQQLDEVVGGHILIEK
ncbi:MAG TPA: vWA domain-containing protein, partial [Phycisphaerae bacterium]